MRGVKISCVKLFLKFLGEKSALFGHLLNFNIGEYDLIPHYRSVYEAVFVLNI